MFTFASFFGTSSLLRFDCPSLPFKLVRITTVYYHSKPLKGHRSRAQLYPALSFPLPLPLTAQRRLQAGQLYVAGRLLSRLLPFHSL